MTNDLTMRAVRLPYEQSITLDGHLDEPAWSITPSYRMRRTQAEADAGMEPREGGVVRLLWDDKYLYVGAELIDSDVVQEDDRDQQHHYQTGDVLEVFVAPVQDGGAVTYYWELYATPNGKKTAFFYPGRGRLTLPSNLDYQSGLRVAAHVDGTLNDWTDRDRGWSAELAIPRKELEQQGVPLEPGRPWRILIGRYNFSAHLPDRELTMVPPLPAASFHTHEHWADLRIEAKGNTP